MKLCQIYNSAAHYRESIFLLIDKTFDFDYVFGESLGDIKQMDTSKFRGCVTKVKNRFFGKGLSWQSGIQKLCFFQWNKLIRYQFVNDIIALIIRSEWRNFNNRIVEVFGVYANLPVEFAHIVVAERRVAS